MPRKPRFSLSPIDNSPGRKLHQAHTRMRQGLSHLFQQAGHPMTTEGWALLSCLWVEDCLTQLELGQRLEKNGPITSRLVDALEKRGYVRRCISRRDRRLREIALTEKGRAARTPLMQIASQFLDEVFAGLSAAELDAFVGTLDHIIQRLDARSTLTEV